MNPVKITAIEKGLGSILLNIFSMSLIIKTKMAVHPQFANYFHLLLRYCQSYLISMHQRYGNICY